MTKGYDMAYIFTRITLDVKRVAAVRDRRLSVNAAYGFRPATGGKGDH